MDEFRYARSEKFKLYFEYEEEMSKYFYPNHTLGSMEDRTQHAGYYLGIPTHLWYDISCRNESIGFFIICTTPDNCHPDYDYTILDAYVRPEYRRQHFLSNSIVSLVHRNPGKYALITFKDNLEAKRVWDNIFVNKLCYFPSHPRFIPNARDFNTTLIGYEPKFKSSFVPKDI